MARARTSARWLDGISLVESGDATAYERYGDCVRRRAKDKGGPKMSPRIEGWAEATRGLRETASPAHYKPRSPQP